MADKAVALVKPSSGRELAFPLGLAALVPGLRKAGYRVDGFDCDLGGFGPFLRGLAAGRYSAVGIGIRWGQVSDAASIIKRIRALVPGVPVFIGGPHPTLFPGESLLETGADVAVMGDGENLFVRALNARLFSGTMPSGTAVRNGQEVYVSGGPVFEEDLDSFPFPDRSFLPLRAYGHAYRSRRYPFAAMVSSRGCHMPCPHCSAPALNPRGFRARAPSAVIEEMWMLDSDHGIKHVHFEDDAFLTDTGRVVSLCEGLLERPVRSSWEIVNGVRPEHVDVNILPLMRRAGCRGIALGVESLVADSAGSAGPMRNRFSAISSIVSAARRCGISCTGYFMLGLPGSANDGDRTTVELAEKAGFDQVHFSPYVPIPGSAWFGTVTGMRAAGETGAMARKASRRFYLRPGRLLGTAMEAVRFPAMARALAGKAAHELAGWEGFR